MDTLLEMKNIKKYFGEVKANDGIDLDIQRGEIHAILGENGAGKTTLMNILYGLYHPDQGEILIKGEEVQISNPKVALHLGIGMVHQHFMLVPPFTVAENISIGLEGQKLYKLDLVDIEDRVRELSQKYGLEVDPKAKVSQLSVGVQQRVEIIKVLYRGAEILVLDEPTAVLTPQEVKELFIVLKNFVVDGGTVIFISHKLKEIMEITDRVTVLRNGTKISTVHTKDTSEKELARMMVGKEVLLKYEKVETKKFEKVLSLKDVYCKNVKGLSAVNGVSFDVYGGEILGIAGVDGNGQKELADVISGINEIDSGEISLNGQNLNELSPYERICIGLGYVPDDRRGVGLLTPFSISMNLAIKHISQQPYKKYGLLNHAYIEQNAKEIIAEYQVKTPSGQVPVSNLSGGNQQKVLLAREISCQPQALVISQPTRGLDIGAMEFIHKTLFRKKSDGTAILLISSDLDEILEVSDRVLVIYEGTIMGEFIPGLIPIEEIGLMMAGVVKKER